MYEGNKVIALWGTILNLLWCNRDKIIASLFTALFFRSLSNNGKFFLMHITLFVMGLKSTWREDISN